MSTICNSYGLAEQFCTIMNGLEKQGITYQDKDPRYLAHERLTKRYMDQYRVTTVTGAMLFSIFHLKSMVSAQKYYHEGFGKPCDI